MKTFVASTEKRYVWNCPYCGEICVDLYKDPEEDESVQCGHCEKEAKCEHTER